MDDLLESERAKYVAAYEIPGYRNACHGLDLWERHRLIFPGYSPTAIDIGCGTGRLFDRWCWEGMIAEGIDFVDALDADHKHPHLLTIGNLWDAQDWRHTYDLGVCCDVMEHIPEERVDAVLLNIRNHCRTTIFKIANFPSNYEGMNLHPTLHDAEWWEARMHAAGFASVELLPIYTGHEEYIFRCTAPQDKA